MGVEIFFVLSGYLIGGILYRLVVTQQQGGRRLGYFLIRRWFRTLPTYCYTIGDIFLNGWWSYFVVKGKRKNKVVNPKKRKT